MEIRQLRYFKAVADASSFVRGADYLNVAQPALSRSIAKLEDELGQSLFVRHSTGVSLTDAGFRFYDRAVDILERLRDLSDDMASHHGDFQGHVAVGAPQSIQAKLLLPVAATFMKRYPECRVDVVQGSSTYLRDRITDSALDIALLSNQMSPSGVHMEPLVSESPCLISPRSESHRFGTSVDLRELEGLPLILSGYPQSIKGLFDQIPSDFAEQLFVRSEVNSSAVVVDMVRQGAGFGIAPNCVIDSRVNDDLAFIPIRGHAIQWAVAVHRRRLGLRAIRELRDLLFERVRELASTGDWPTAKVLET